MAVLISVPPCLIPTTSVLTLSAPATVATLLVLFASRLFAQTGPESLFSLKSMVLVFPQLSHLGTYPSSAR